MAKPENLPHNWEYQLETNSVICGGCAFRYGAEHSDGDGKWTCPNCGDGNANQQLKRNGYETMRDTLLYIQALTERGYPIDNAKLAMQCRLALTPRNILGEGMTK